MKTDVQYNSLQVEDMASMLLVIHLPVLLNTNFFVALYMTEEKIASLVTRRAKHFHDTEILMSMLFHVNLYGNAVL